jgi:hypothetical protein
MGGPRSTLLWWTDSGMDSGIRIESIPFSKFENFTWRIFEISREYTIATRPSPLFTHSTHTTDTGMSILWSISPGSSQVLWSTTFSVVDHFSVVGRFGGFLCIDCKCSLRTMLRTYLRYLSVYRHSSTHSTRHRRARPIFTGGQAGGAAPLHAHE